MRILQVATLVTPDGAYGGPVRVAVNQVRALLERGHDVAFAAGASGFGRVLPTDFDGVPVHLFPVRRVLPRSGFAALASPGMLAWLRSSLAGADLMHVHMARDLITMPAAALARREGKPYVIQTHGMIIPSGKLLARPLDTMFTRPLMAHAERAFFLTEEERAGLNNVADGKLRLTHLHNGVPSQEPQPEASRDTIEVLYLARLHSRKRPMHFVRMAQALHPRFPNVKFRLVGPDEGAGAAVQQAIEQAGLGGALKWEGSLSAGRTAERMARATLYVLPSVDEPFPMSVLEAMSLGKPVVVTRSCGLASVVESTGAGIVADESLESLINSVAVLLDDPATLGSCGRAAESCARRDFSMEGVVNLLEQHYGEISAQESTRSR